MARRIGNRVAWSKAWPSFSSMVASEGIAVFRLGGVMTRESANVYNVLLVDDLAPWRNEIRLLLKSRPELNIVGEACDGQEAIGMATELRPDVVLLDVGMPNLNGIEAAKQIQQTAPQSKIVFLTQESDADIRSAALATGAHGYFLKIDARTKLLPTITAVLSNGHQTS